MYMCGERVLDVLETQAHFLPPPAHTPGKVWGADLRAAFSPFLAQACDGVSSGAAKSIRLCK